MNRLLNSRGWAFPLALSGVALGGDGVGVRYIELKDAIFPSWALMSDDGQTVVNYGDFGSSVLLDSGHGWETITEGLPHSSFFNPSGISDDGSVVSVSAENYRNYIWRLGEIEVLPDLVIDGDVERGWVTAVSGDGLTAGVRGAGESECGLYLYREGAYLDMGVEIQGGRVGPLLVGLDRTGSVAAINNGGYVTLDSGQEYWQGRAWSWVEGDLTQIPDLDLGAELVHSEVGGVSSDGQSFFGLSRGFDEELQRYEFWHGWVYRDGVQHSVDGGAFAFSEVVDISDDGSIALVTAGIEDEDNGEGYLWTETGGLTLISDVLIELGIDIDGDVFHFYSLSGDGRSIAGTAYHYTGEERISQFVVTIPSPGALMMLGGGLLMLSGRRR